MANSNVLDSLTYLSEGILASHQEKLLALIQKGWEPFYREIFGDKLVDVFDSVETDDMHHTEAVEWHWYGRLALLTGERPPNDHFAYFPTWSRGNMKSSLLRTMTVTDAMLSYAYGEQGYALMPAGTKGKVRGNALSIEELLHSAKVIEYCPDLSKVRSNVYGRSRGWTANFISTEAGYVFHFVGVDEGVAGANVDNVRPTWIGIDDIDDRNQSPVISETRFRVLTSEILPTRQQNTLIFWAQNLINRWSVRYRVESQQEKILVNRRKNDPIPAVRNPVWQQKVVDGLVKDILVAGECTWRGWNLQRAQDEIDTYGREAFERECLHMVTESKEGLILYNYNDDVHVISESEFSSVYGSKDIWLSWRKKCGNDWARTKTDKHANVAAWLTVSSQDSELPNYTFLMHPMSFPPESAPEDVAERLLSCLDPYAYKDNQKQVTWGELRKELLKRANSDAHTKTVQEKIAYEHGELAKIIPKYTKPLLYRCNVQQGDMSHEASTPRKIYASIYGMGMRPVNPHKHGGIELINREMQVDYDTPHPFRPNQMGFTRWFMVVPDDKNSPYTNQQGATVYLPKKYPEAIQTKDLHDDDLFRFHFCNWRYREPTLTASGEVIDDPLKMFDDAGNLLQMMAVGSSLQGTLLNKEQKIRMLMPRQTLEGMKTAKTSGDRLVSALAYEWSREIAELTLDPQRRDLLEDLE
jgi:hypothetical protein